MIIHNHEVICQKHKEIIQPQWVHIQWHRVNTPQLLAMRILPKTRIPSQLVLVVNLQQTMRWQWGIGLFLLGLVRIPTDIEIRLLDNIHQLFGAYSKTSATYAITLGSYTKASGYGSIAQGWNTRASGSYASSFGYNTEASGYNAKSSGYSTVASGDYSSSQGYQSIASGDHANATGYLDTASGVMSTAIGYRSNASGNYSTVIGSYGSTAGLSRCHDS